MAINDPRDISGLVVWYSADAETGYSDGQSMTTWTDLSGNGNHATAAGDAPPQWESSTGANSGAAVKFRGSGVLGSPTGWSYFTLPSSLLGSATAGEMVVSLKADTASGQSSSWSFGVIAGATAMSHYPFSSAVYESFGTTSRKTIGNPANSPASVTITNWHRYNVWSAANDFAARFNAVTQFSTTTNTVTWDSSPAIGHGKKSGALAVGDESHFKGHIGCLVVYSRKLTTTERADLDTWLAANPSGGTANNDRSGSLAATLPSPAASLSGTYTPPPVTGTLAATLPSLTTALNGNTGQVVGALTAAIPPLTTALTGTYTAPITGTLTATIPALTATLTAALTVNAETDIADRANGRTRTGLGYAVVDPVLVEMPPREPHRSMSQSVPAPTLDDGRPQ